MQVHHIRPRMKASRTLNGCATLDHVLSVPDLILGPVAAPSDAKRPSDRRLVGTSQAQRDTVLPSPTTSSLMNRTHAGIRRAIGTAQAAKAPAVLADLKRMLAKLPNTRVGLRDRALLLFGFAGAFRRS